MGYFKDFVPQLAARRLGASLLYEVKSNLGREQLRLLREAGIRRIQPGIESLSDPILKLMRKGVSALQNVQLLKWCKELGIEAYWNLLWGFPGEPPEEYERMAGVVPLLRHLEAPVDYGIIRLDRFSPNFDHAARLGFAEVAPVPPYRYVYALPDEALANLAYFFTFRYGEPRDVSGYVARLEARLRTWSRTRGQYDLFFVDLGESLLVWDLRPRRRTLLTLLSGADRRLYLACDRACDLRRLSELVAQDSGSPLSSEAIADRLRPLVDAGLLLRDGSRYLALAVRLGGSYSPSARAVARFYAQARALGRRVREGWIVSPGRAAGPSRAARTPLGARRRRAVSRVPGRLTAAQFALVPPGEVLVVGGRRASCHERRG
jgi:ribosomal peptide maturation radical SAM protein 1